MEPPPALSSRPPAAQVVLAGVVPALFGAVTGVMVGVGELPYLILALLGIAGGFLAGLEHRGARSGARRGLLGGALFGAFILLAHEATGAEAKAELPHPAILLVVVTSVFGVGLGALGGRRRAKLERSAGARMEDAPEPVAGEPEAGPEPVATAAPATRDDDDRPRTRGRAAAASSSAVWGLLWLLALGLAAVSALLFVLALTGEVVRVF